MGHELIVGSVIFSPEEHAIMRANLHSVPPGAFVGATDGDDFVGLITRDGPPGLRDKVSGLPGYARRMLHGVLTGGRAVAVNA